jgi:hypothetical protein
MKRLGSSLPKPATLIAVLALVVATGGTGYAVTQVTGKDVKNSSLTGKDIKNGSLSAKDADASLHGQTGPQGPAGPSGKASFTTVTNAMPSAVGTHEGTADCPLGSKVVGGGYVVNPNLNVAVVRSYPVDVDSWLVRVYDSTTVANFAITIYATCAT